MSALYADRAELYDLIYHWKDYAAEARRVRSLLLDEGVVDGASVVEAACGTGQYLRELSRWYEARGYDLNEAMVRCAHAKGCRAEVADMRGHRFGPVDAVLCLFSSIGYVRPQDLDAVASCWWESVRPGGVGLIEPWISPDAAVSGHMNTHTYDSDALKLVRAAVHLREGEVSVLDFHWLVLRPQGVEHFVDAHRLHLTSPEELAAPFRRVGFQVRFEEHGLMPGRGLLVLRRP